VVEYLMIVGVVALAAIHGFKLARFRENRIIARQGKIVLTLDNSTDDPSFDDPVFGDDPTAPFCTIGGTCSGPGQCFAKGTLVDTESGLVPIETIRKGDLIWSRDETTGGAVALRPVLRRYVTNGQAVMSLNIATPDGEETIRSTSGHPFWVAGKGWVSAAALSVNQELWSPLGESLHVAPAGSPEIQYETVYNLEIAEFHTYFVGHHQLWVHNATTPPPGNPSAPCQQPGYKPPPVGGTLAYAEQAKNKSGKSFPLGGSFQEMNAFRTTTNRYNPNQPTKQIGGEIHHTPAKDIWNKWPASAGPAPFDEKTGPAVWLEEADHEATASYGSGAKADKYRQDQADLIAKGDLCGAIAMDIKDIRSLSDPPDKYEKGIAQMLAYVNSKGYNCTSP